MNWTVVLIILAALWVLLAIRSHLLSASNVIPFAPTSPTQHISNFITRFKIRNRFFRGEDWYIVDMVAIVFSFLHHYEHLNGDDFDIEIDPKIEQIGKAMASLLNEHGKSISKKSYVTKEAWEENRKNIAFELEKIRKAMLDFICVYDGGYESAYDSKEDAQQRELNPRKSLETAQMHIENMLKICRKSHLRLIIS